MCTAVNMFGATKTFPFFLEAMGFHGTFWMYGSVLVFEVIYAAFILPENKGQSLVKTEDKMIGGKDTTKLDETVSFVEIKTNSSKEDTETNRKV